MADLEGGWAGFWGVASQLSRISIVMNISIANSASAALSNGCLIRELLVGRARSRREVAGADFRGEYLPVGNPATRLRALAGHPRTADAPNDRPTKQLKLEKGI